MRSAALLCVALALVGCAGQASASRQLTQAAEPTLAGALAGIKDLSTLLELVKVSSLLNATLNPSTNVTVFAPTNEAFATLLVALNTTKAAVANNTALVDAVLSTHVLPVPRLAASFSDGEALPTLLNGTSLVVSINGTSVQILTPTSTANVIKADTKVGGSVVHIIDTVLLA